MHELDQGHHTRGRPQKSHIDCDFWEHKQKHTHSLSLSLSPSLSCSHFDVILALLVLMPMFHFPRFLTLQIWVSSNTCRKLQYDMTFSLQPSISHDIQLQVAWQEFSIRVFLTQSNSKLGKDKSHLVSCNTTMTDCDDNNCHILNIIPVLCIEPVRPGMWIQQMLQELQTEIS
jgi:hypothetical protein